MARELKKPVDDMVINDGKVIINIKHFIKIDIVCQTFNDLFCKQYLTVLTTSQTLPDKQNIVGKVFVTVNKHFLPALAKDL